MRKIFLVAVCFICFQSLTAQSFWFGPKIGPTMAFQKWNSFDQQPLFTGHAALFVESYADESDSGSLYAQLGYHTRGSAIRYTSVNTFSSLTEGFKFNNIALQLGVKRFVKNTSASKTYYLVGVRLEYTIKNNLQDPSDPTMTNINPYFPISDFTNKINYGISFGGGYSFNFTELLGGFVDLSFHPDVSFQYQQPAIDGVINPFTGNASTLGERQIRNLSVELSV